MFHFEVSERHLRAPSPVRKNDFGHEGDSTPGSSTWTHDHGLPIPAQRASFRLMADELALPEIPSMMVHTVPSTELVVEHIPGHGTPPIRILTPTNAPRRILRVSESNLEPFIEQRPATPSALSAGKIRSKRRKNRKVAKGAALATNTVIGFTPAASGDDDSEASSIGTPSGLNRRLMDLSSNSNSPVVRPSSACSQGGISALKLQLEALSLETRNGQQKSQASDLHHPLSPQLSSGAETSLGDGSDGSATPKTYEVPLEHDFVSSDVATVQSCSDAFPSHSKKYTTQIARKMTAADFTPLRCLGKGTYGTVLLVRQNSTGRLFAQKQFRKASMIVNKHLVEQTKTERAILESINRHPFVVKLFYAFHDHEKLYLILEYAQGGELTTHLAAERMFCEPVAAFYMAEMVLALEHLHTNLGVVYRDLKPENILLDTEGHILLTDFGLSKVPVDENDQCKSIAGTDVYMAPEVILGKKYGSAVDWWSFGALGFDLLTGAPPFPGGNHARIKEKIVHGRLQLPYFLSADAKDLLTRLLRKEPSKRLGWDLKNDLHKIKNHRFFRKIDWKKLEKRELTPPITPMITDPELAENFSNSFTDLAVSPVVRERAMVIGEAGSGGREKTEVDPFGGFSFVASNSLLDRGW